MAKDVALAVDLGAVSGRVMADAADHGWSPAGCRLKAKLRNGDVAFGLWFTLETPSITEIAAQISLDWVCIDTEHGHLDFKEVVEHLRAAKGSRTACLVRVPGIEQGPIKRVLDLGADGIIVPQVRTRADVESVVSCAKYPPHGRRGIGGERPTRWGRGLKLARTANQNTLVIPIIENLEAGKNIEAMLDVPGVDAFFFGPADYTASAGFPGEWETKTVARELVRLKDQTRQRRIPCGIIATSVQDGRCRLRQGFQMLGLGSDCGMLIHSITDSLAKHGRTINASVWER